MGLVFLVVGTALALLWPAYLNNGPFWFPDTSNYIRAADAATVYIGGSPSEWSDRLAMGEGGQRADKIADVILDEDRADITPTRPVLAGRSIYFGFLIYLPMRIAGPWGAILLQALLVAGVIVFVGRLLLSQIPRIQSKWLMVFLGALIAFTPLPFFTSMLMPDVYSGLLLVALGAAMVFWIRLGLADRIGLIGVASLIATFHTSNVLLAGCIVLAAIPLSALAAGSFTRAVWAPVFIGLPVLLSGIGSTMLFAAIVSNALGAAPVSPPFLSARITAAGPGTIYLERVCGRNPSMWELCSHRHRLSQWSDSFLWSQGADTGVFQLASPEQQERMAREDKRFFLAVLADDPIAVTKASLLSTGEQLTSFSLLEFNYPVSGETELVRKYPASIAEHIAATRAATGSMPTDVAEWIQMTMLGIVLVVVLWAFLSKGRQVFRRLTPTAQLAALLFIGVLANAAICGAFSGPHPRYQMRLIWVVQLATGLTLLGVSTATGRSASLRLQEDLQVPAVPNRPDVEFPGDHERRCPE